jgi:hypothetical protein
VRSWCAAYETVAGRNRDADGLTDRGQLSELLIDGEGPMEVRPPHCSLALRRTTEVGC